MKTLTTKIAKNGATIYYADGKRVSHAEYCRIYRENKFAAKLQNKYAIEAIIDATDDYVITAEAQNAATDAEQTAAANNNLSEEENTMTINTKSATIAAIEPTTEYKYFIKSRRPIFGAVPAGYINSFAGEVYDNRRMPDGKIVPCRVPFFGFAIYDHPLTEKQILGYDLAVSFETREFLNNTPETDGSEDDDTPEYVEPEPGTTGGLPDLYEVTEFTDNGKLYTTFDNLRDAFNFINDSQFPADILLIKGERGYFICDDTGKFVTSREKFSTAVHCLIEERDNSNAFDLLPELDELNDVDDGEPTAVSRREKWIFTPSGNIIQTLSFDNVRREEWTFTPSGNIVQTLFFNDVRREEWTFTPFGNTIQALFFDDEKAYFVDGELNRIWSDKYHAGINTLVRDSVNVVVYNDDGSHKFKEFFLDELTDEFWELMAERGACTIDDEPEEPTTNETVAAVAETLSDINQNAPDGWEVFYDCSAKNFTVTFDDKPVANLDSLALLKILPPDEFFAKFQSTAEEQFAADRQREVAALKEMRKQLSDDAERLKIIDDLIRDAENA